MRAYALRRVLLVIPTLIGVSLLTFILVQFTPGDPAEGFASRILARPATFEEVEQARKDLGLDRPVVVQYVSWVGNVVQGDLGRSFSSREQISTELKRRVPRTMQLAIPAALLALAISVPAGIICAIKRNRFVDQIVRVTSLAGASMPSFWLALILIIVFAVRLNLLPVAGRGDFRNMILPVVTLSLAPAATLTRFIRSAVLEALSSNYVITARAKGVKELFVVGRHALRNSMVTVVTAFGNSFGHMLAGAAVVETIFVWPGSGKQLVDAIAQRDYPMIQAFILYIGVIFVIVNLIVDLCYAWIDPRISLKKEPAAV